MARGAPAGAATSVDLHRKLVAITGFRVGIISVLLAATVAVTFSERDSFTGPVQNLLYGLTVAVYLASVGYLLALRSPRLRVTPLVYVQTVGDIVTASFLVWLTGGPDSIFPFLYAIAVINGAILLSRKAAFVAAALSFASYAWVTLGLAAHLLPPPADYLAPAPMSGARLAYNLLVNGTGVFLVAALASYMAEQARSAGQQLSAAVEDYVALAVTHERIVQSVASGIMTVNARGAVTFLNRAGEELIGRRLREVRGRAMEEIIPALWRRVQAVSEVGEADRGEVKVSTPSGPRVLGFSVAPLGGDRGAEGEAEGGEVIIFQDLTALHKMEAQLQRNERLAALGAVAAGLAHEIRNPLASVSGSVELMRHALPPGADEDRLMNIVIREVERLNLLITDFLQFARPAPPTLAPVDLGALVGEIVEIMRNDPAAQDRELVLPGPGAWWVRADGSQLRQVLVNLLLNAAQATRPGGRVEVLLEPHEGMVALRVRDDGAGLKPETLEHIFDPFYTTKEAGTGLGLATVHRTVEAHHGRVEVESVEGEGSCFSIFLPASDGLATSAQAQA